MSEPLSVDLGVGDWLIYMTERALARLGKGRLSSDEEERLTAVVKRGVHRAATVMCIGMSHPVPITKIYQPTRLSRAGSTLDASHITSKASDALILAGPGRGKTTLLHWLYVSLLDSEDIYPLLFTLRRSGEIEELESCIKLATSNKLQSKSGKRRLLFLVDGYDEISEGDRKKVSVILNDLSSSGEGNYAMTCRLYYDLIDLKASIYQIEGFSQEDALNFVRSFSSAYRIAIHPESLLEDLQARGFTDFLASPLLLTLVCILKTGSQPEIPKRTIPLLRNAIDVLRLKWDYEKGVRRESRFPLDGEERIRCLMRIAFHMPKLEELDQAIMRQCREFLKLAKARNVDPREFLLEVAQWYGLFVPVEETRWTFTHRTIHDFLAARYWVESGLFRPSLVNEWNSRSAYAASLLHDATEALSLVLEGKFVHAFVEILNNNPPYNPSRIATALQKYYNRSPHMFAVRLTNQGVVTRVTHDFFASMSHELLCSLCMSITRAKSSVSMLMVAYGLAELSERRSIPSSLLSQLRPVLGESFMFEVERGGSYSLSFGLPDPYAFTKVAR